MNSIFFYNRTDRNGIREKTSIDMFHIAHLAISQHNPFLFTKCAQLVIHSISVKTRRPASADRTARRQFQATGQLVSRTQASDAMTSRLPRYEAKCVQRSCFQFGSVPLHSDIKGTELPLPIY